jgi:hypothetical protein
MIPQHLREQLVQTVCGIPSTYTESGRGALLTGIPIPIVCNLRDSNQHTDISNMVNLLAECYGRGPRREWWLLQFIGNAQSAASGLALIGTLERIKQDLVADQQTAFVNWAEMAQVHFFDLRQPVMRCVLELPRNGGVSGFVIRGASRIILDYFCQSLPYRGETWSRLWKRSQLFPSNAMRIRQLETAVSVAVRTIQQFERLIKTKHVVWAAEVESEDDAEFIWQSTKVMFGLPPANHLILILGMPEDQKPPTEMKILESPVFDAQEVRAWVEDIAKIRLWNNLLVDRWTKVLVTGCSNGEFPSPEMLYRNLERFHRLLVCHSEDDQALEEALVVFEDLGGMR